MTEENTFQPITSQEELDQVLASRLAREKEKFQKESGVDELKAELEEVRREHYQQEARRAVAETLAGRGVTDEGRMQKVMRLVDLSAIEPDEEGRPRREHVLSQVDGVAKDLPELVRPRGAGSRGSKFQVAEQEKPLTREQVESMSPEEQRKPGMKERIDKFLRGQRSEGPDIADLR